MWSLYLDFLESCAPNDSSLSVDLQNISESYKSTMQLFHHCKESSAVRIHRAESETQTRNERFWVEQLSH